MPNPRFRVGDRVSLGHSGIDRTRTPGTYIITRILPLEQARGFQYRARNELDPHERAFDEGELISV